MVARCVDSWVARLYDRQVGWFDFLFPIALGEAHLRVVEPSGRTFRVRFVLKSLKLSKTNHFASAPVPGLNAELLQFIRGQARELSLSLYFDGRPSNTDVRQPMLDVMGLMNIDPATHAPPVLSFEWTGFALRCVLVSSTVEAFRSSFPDGRPSRGRMRVTFREFKTLQELLQEAGQQ